MRRADKLLLRLRSLFRRGSVEQELDAELRFHFEQQIEENLAAGMSAEAAQHAARRSIGGLAQIQEECRDMRRVNLIQNFLQDFRYAVRLLRKSAGFTTVAVLSLALGVGANTAVFSVIHAVLLRSLLYPDPDRLVRLMRQFPQEIDDALSIPQFEFWKEHSAAFESLAGYRSAGDVSFVSGAGREWITRMRITADFFRTLGVSPVLGREFQLQETRPGGPRAVILSDNLWRRQFNRNPKVLGTALTLDGESCTVVGVLPRGFWFPQTVDAFVPLRPAGGLADTGSNTQVFARLKPGLVRRRAIAACTPTKCCAMSAAWR
jgi:macrolide transport system ATP-binding/permease protein